MCGFFVLVAQEHEQRQDGLDQAEREHQPIEFVHDITPSLVERKPTHQTACRDEYITCSCIFQAKLMRRHVEKNFFGLKVFFFTCRNSERA